MLIQTYDCDSGLYSSASQLVFFLYTACITAIYSGALVHRNNAMAGSRGAHLSATVLVLLACVAHKSQALFWPLKGTANMHAEAGYVKGIQAAR